MLFSIIDPSSEESTEGYGYQLFDQPAEGYDYQFVDPGLAVDQKCLICRLVVRNAHQVTCCGKLFCKVCLEKWLDRSKDCPHCRKIINDKYFQDTRADREIKDLKVYCDNKKSGCDWSGELRSVEEHMDGCVYQNIECEDCYQSLLKLQLEKHLADDCSERKHVCPSCSTEGTYRFITTEHQDTCPEKELVCQNTGCTTVVKRHEMPSHVEECPKEKIKCPFYYQGCDFICERENALGHIEQNVPQHVEMIRKDVPHSTAPIVIKMDKFSLCKEEEEEWYSDGFYTGPGGYKVRLVVDADGSDDGKSTHVSVYINLMPGVNDDNLEFPMRGKIRVELLNQVEDSHHYIRTVFNNDPVDNDEDDDYDPDCLRKSEIDESCYGLAKFIKYSSLVDESKNIQYLTNNVMYFRVTAKMYSTKPWLVDPV